MATERVQMIKKGVYNKECITFFFNEIMKNNNC